MHSWPCSSKEEYYVPENLEKEATSLKAKKTLFYLVLPCLSTLFRKTCFVFVHVLYSTRQLPYNLIMVVIYRKHTLASGSVTYGVIS